MGATHLRHNRIMRCRALRLPGPKRTSRQAACTGTCRHVDRLYTPPSCLTGQHGGGACRCSHPDATHPRPGCSAARVRPTTTCQASSFTKPTTLSSCGMPEQQRSLCCHACCPRSRLNANPLHHAMTHHRYPCTGSLSCGLLHTSVWPASAASLSTRRP